MIIRIFRVHVPQNLQREFEEKFILISAPFVKASPGLMRAIIGKPIDPDSQIYTMISEWESIEAIAHFAGDNWHQAVIPSGMEKYVQECWVEHFEKFGVE